MPPRAPFAAAAFRFGGTLQPQPRAPITAIGDALDVFDFDEAARRTLPPAHYGYLATGTDDDATLRANRDAFARYHLRPRRLVNVATPDLSVSLFGARFDTPIALAPVGSLLAFHPEGELAVARAARAGRYLQILSTVASHGVEAVNEARGEPVWFQLYATNDFSVTRALVARADKAGCPVLVLTVDNLGNNRLTQERVTRTDTRPCNACHPPPNPRYFTRRPMFSGLDLTKAMRLSPQDWNWDFVGRLRDLTRMKIVLKGIVTGEDAELARARGVDGLIVRTTAADPRTAAAARSSASPKSSPAPAARCPFSSTAASVAAPTSSRPWRSAPPPSASAGRMSGASPASASRASKPSSRCCAANWSSSCASPARPRSRQSRRNTSNG